MKKFDFIVTPVDSESGRYILYNDHIKEITKLKASELGAENLCVTCNKNKICNPHNNYGIIAIECLKYKKRK